MISLVTNYENTNKKKYIISKKDFKNLQKEARFEMSNLYLNNSYYAKAFYNSFLLLRKHPKNKYLKKTLTFSIYGLSKMKMEGGFNDVIVSYKKIEGNSQRVNYLFKKMEPKNLSALSIKWLWKYKKEYPTDDFIQSLLDDATYAFIYHYDVKLSHFYRPNTVINTDSINDKPKFQKLSNEEYIALNKYDKIRYDKKYEKYYGSSHGSSKKIVKTDNFRFILSSESTDSDFKEFYNAIYNNVKEDKDKEEDKDKDKKSIVYNKKLQIDNLILLNPVYYYVKNGNLKITDFEKKENRISKSFKTIANQEGINVSIIDIMNITEEDVDRFNDLTIMNSWQQEFEYITDNNGQAKLIPWQTNYIQNIREKYNMRYISSMGVLDEKSIKNGNNILYNIFGAAIFLPAAPYFLSKAFSDINLVYHLFYCVDLETNKVIYYNLENFEGKSSMDIIKSLNYNVINELKKI